VVKNLKESPAIILKTHEGEDVQYPRPKHPVFNRTPGEGISWAEWSWNPVTGCLRGCPYCYARDISTNPAMAQVYPVGFTPLFHHERLACPKNTSMPKTDDPAAWRVFVCSMSDLYGQWVPSDWIEQVHQACAESPQWQYIHLTKNPARYNKLPPPPGSWVGASVDEQKMVRIAENAARNLEGAAVKWLSIEPMREELRFNDLSMFDWVVIGAQTETWQPNANGSRSIYPSFAPPFEWVMRIVAQAREAGCRIHMKPNLLGALGPKNPGMQLINEFPEAKKSPQWRCLRRIEKRLTGCVNLF
jgi:protein gp37